MNFIYFSFFVFLFSLNTFPTPHTIKKRILFFSSSPLLTNKILYSNAVAWFFPTLLVIPMLPIAKYFLFFSIFVRSLVLLFRFGNIGTPKMACSCLTFLFFFQWTFFCRFFFLPSGRFGLLLNFTIVLLQRGIWIRKRPVWNDAKRKRLTTDPPRECKARLIWAVAEVLVAADRPRWSPLDRCHHL